MRGGDQRRDPGLASGVRIRTSTPRACAETIARMGSWLNALGLRSADADCVHCSSDAQGVRFVLRRGAVRAWAPEHSTLALCRTLGLRHDDDVDLEREIIVAMLLAPVTVEFPSFEEFESAVRIRRLMVRAARLTALNFDTDAIERPEDCWQYNEHTGFTVRPGHCLIESLRKATQPEITGRLYAFSCYRATEYVMLLAIAQEAERANPQLRQVMQHQAERRAIQSGEFHDVYLREYGSMRAPLPARYYVPGDRIWFRNPDEHSADAKGYEGSWVIYLGDGLFSNFWKRDQPFSFVGKCVEIFHWRSGAWRDRDGVMRMDEDEVERRCEATLSDPGELEQIMRRMMRPRAPRGTFGGGCIDTTREFSRWIHPDTCDIALPGH